MIRNNNLEEIKEIIETNEMVLAYFTSTDCNMCKDLFPKVEAMLNNFVNVTGLRGEVDQTLTIMGAYNVLTVPTMILFVQGKETLRMSRQINLQEFNQTIQRYDQLLHEA